MTDRELMQQALEALEQVAEYFRDDSCEAKTITALRKRLAQPEQEPVALPEKMYEFVPTPEPSKWHHPECEGECIACLIERVVQEAYGSQGLGYLQRHLTTSPQRKPLTDEEIWEFWWSRPEVPEGEDDSMEAEFVAAVKRVLAAHGIKENT